MHPCPKLMAAAFLSAAQIALSLSNIEELWCKAAAPNVDEACQFFGAGSETCRVASAQMKGHCAEARTKIGEEMQNSDEAGNFSRGASLLATSGNPKSTAGSATTRDQQQSHSPAIEHGHGKGEAPFKGDVHMARKLLHTMDAADGKGVSVKTASDFKYHHALTSLPQPTKLKITVDAKSDAHIFLSSGGAPHKNRRNGYEIILGGWKNTKSLLKDATRDVLKWKQGSIFGGGPKTFIVEKSSSRLSVKSEDGSTMLQLDECASQVVKEVWVMTCCGSTGQWTMAKQEPEKDKDKPVSVRKPFNGIRLQANADNTGFVDYSECEDYEAQVDPCYQVVANRDPSRTMVQPLIGINLNLINGWKMQCALPKYNTPSYLRQSAQLSVTPPGSVKSYKQMQNGRKTLLLQKPTAKCLVCPDGFLPRHFESGTPPKTLPEKRKPPFCFDRTNKMNCDNINDMLRDLDLKLLQKGLDPLQTNGKAPGSFGSPQCYPAKPPTKKGMPDLHCSKNGIHWTTVDTNEGGQFWLIFCTFFKHVMCPAGTSICFTEKAVTFQRAILKQSYNSKATKTVDKITFASVPVLKAAEEEHGLCRPVAALI